MGDIADDLNLGQKISAWIKDVIVDPAYNFINELGNNGQWWLEVIILAVAAILLVCGLIFLIVKSWKILLVLFVLAGIGLIVYYAFIKKEEVPTEATISSIKTTFTLLKAFL